MNLYYNWDRDTDEIKPATLETVDWDAKDRRVALNEDDGFMVSTVFLNLDHSLVFGDGDSEPLVFETMVFLFDMPMDVWMERYSTAEQARDGHHEALDFLTESLIPDLLKLGSVRRIKRFMRKEFYARDYNSTVIARSIHKWRKNRKALEQVNLDAQLNMAGCDDE